MFFQLLAKNRINAICFEYYEVIRRLYDAVWGGGAIQRFRRAVREQTFSDAFADEGWSVPVFP